ncbi:calcium-binding and coiled-coil domain-containing protein 1 isoform X1 [Poecilia latipinna]|uniref:calcium-binding and coiled-coil domain-containing protein 1 isoform X1 n=1 Tax=Poecilia latipinna TaxID=48699 RepID=UPI00072E796D|nr:PREDICTED: calcium-binding and coiled-coil domain-containing protein 1 isoform X1 [Poecilia latipinna]XP_014875844.1 PREDICTED: calcium-binding and coiled-coil domain-containing protein 1 isoform X1 [Poecilia latipinna]
MDKQPVVVFRNVGQLYFPQTRVECHYSLTSEHGWSSSDWIGIFQMGWSSVKQYHTYTWALVPEGYTEGTSVNHCAVFQASYLPSPSAVEYQFAYVDKEGKVCARSRPFTFCAPKPLEELETLKEEQDEEDGEEEDLMLVIPRAQLLQSRLEQSLKKQAGLQRALDDAKKEAEAEKETSKRARLEWETERQAMKEEITELRDNLRQSCEMLKRLEEKHMDVRYSQEIQSSELRKLVAEKGESLQQVQDLRDEVKVLADREEQANMELQRLKERVKKMSSQMKHDEDKRKSLQVEVEASAAELHSLQEQLEASDHVAEGLRKELRDLSTQRNHTHAELHQVRLQVAQFTLQLSDQDLALKEERATWALEREAYRHAAEVDKKKVQDLSCELQRKEEWLQEERTERDNLEAELGREKVLLSEAKRELQELKAALRKVQKGREQELLHKQDLVTCIRQLEMKLGIGEETDPNNTEVKRISPGSSSEKQDLAPSAAPRSASSSSSPEESSTSEIPAETLSQSEGDESPVDSQDEKSQLSKAQPGEGKQLILPELVNPVLSELADSPMW